MPVAGLTNVAYRDVGNSGVVDLAPLASLLVLTSLTIEGDAVADLHRSPSSQR